MFETCCNYVVSSSPLLSFVAAGVGMMLLLGEFDHWRIARLRARKRSAAKQDVPSEV